MRECRRAGSGATGSARLHLNDSQTPLGSNRDRHANIGEGELGEEGCARLPVGAPLQTPAVRAGDARARTAAGPRARKSRWRCKLRDARRRGARR